MKSSAARFLTLTTCMSVKALRNVGLVFIKPHAATATVDTFVREHLAAAGVKVVDSGIKQASEIDGQKLIDQHYGSLAQLAMDTAPADLALTPAAIDAFQSTYGLPWAEAIGSTMKNGDALRSLGVDGQELERMWRGGKDLKLAPGTYISQLDKPGDAVWTINGFYPAMRQAFVAPGASIRYMVCEWEESELSWKSFRRDVIGATDPADAAAGSCRAEMRSRWEELGLTSEPSMKENGVHASAGPLEGLKERCVWCGSDLVTDAFAAELVAAGIDAPTLDAWLRENPVVTLGGETDKLFDLTEEMGCDAVMQLCRSWKPPAPPKGGEPGAAPESAPPAGFAWGGVY